MEVKLKQFRIKCVLVLNISQHIIHPTQRSCGETEIEGKKRTESELTWELSTGRRILIGVLRNLSENEITRIKCQKKDII